MSNLSIHGMNLLAKTAGERGEPLRVRFTLPSEEQPLTVSGIIRWTGSGPPTDGERPLGIEFVEVDDTSRFRLQAFVTSHVQPSRRVGPLGRPARRLLELPDAARLVRVSGLLIGGLLVAGLCAWIVSLNRTTARLSQDLAERTILVSQLEARHAKLQQVLGQSNALMTQNLTEMDRLQQQRAQLEGEVRGLAQGLEELTRAYVRVQDERKVLQQRVAQLERQEAVFTQRLSSIPELRKAMRQVQLARRRQLREEQQQRLQRLREADRRDLQRGNRGYLIHAGRPTFTSATLSIRVHTPEPTE